MTELTQHQDTRGVQPGIPFYRPATKADALAMVELVNIAGEGLPEYLWSNLAAPGQSAQDVGIERARRDSGGFSWRNTEVCEIYGKVAAAIVGYALDSEPAPANYADMPPLFVPLQQLEDMAPGTWYVNILATYPDYRGKGIGRELLVRAEQKARALGLHGMSIIMVDNNAIARKLYESCGYRERARRFIVKENWQHSAKEWVLLTTEL